MDHHRVFLRPRGDGAIHASLGQAAALAPQLQKVEAAFPAEFKDKQVMLISYAPGKGATIAIQGGNTLTLDVKDPSKPEIVSKLKDGVEVKPAQ